MKNSKSGNKSKNIEKLTSNQKKQKTIRPLEDDIREKANEIYLQRIDRGEEGSAENDWIEAEKFLTRFEI
jgi:hypothetical protein